MSAPMDDLCTEHEEAGRMGETDRAKARALLDAIAAGAVPAWTTHGRRTLVGARGIETMIQIAHPVAAMLQGYLASDDGAAEARAEKAEAALKRAIEHRGTANARAAIAEHHRDEASRQRNAALADIHHAINSEDTRAYLVSRYGREANDG